MIELAETLKSQEDESVNFIFKGDFPGYYEARYVRRSPNYFVVYLSSQSGCKQACKFCHLTATKQTALQNADMDSFLAQSKKVLEYYQTQPKAEIVHYGFMARGEPLDNPCLLRNDTDSSILRLLGQRARYLGLFPRFTISTILPQSIKDEKLINLFPEIHPDIYYSIYTMNQNFKKKWMPNALPSEEGLKKLVEWQECTKKIPRLHWCFIKGENDSEQDVNGICEAVNDLGLRVDINIVRYNPFSDKLGEEPSEEVIQSNVDILMCNLPKSTKIKVVNRVGRDVAASCGVFLDKNSI